MKKFLCILLALICVSMLGGCIEIEFEDSDTTTENAVADNDETTTTESAENIKDKIGVEIVKADGAEWRGVGVIVKNGSASLIGSLTVQVLFYDDADNIVATESAEHSYVLPGSKVASYIEAPDNYARYDYKVSIDTEIGGYINKANEVDVKTNIGEDCIILQFTNNADAEIEYFEYAVVFYKNGKVIDVANGWDIDTIASGDTAITECSTWDVDFDDYEVYINKAHVMGW